MDTTILNKILKELAKLYDSDWQKLSCQLSCHCQCHGWLHLDLIMNEIAGKQLRYQLQVVS